MVQKSNPATPKISDAEQLLVKAWEAAEREFEKNNAGALKDKIARAHPVSHEDKGVHKHTAPSTQFDHHQTEFMVNAKEQTQERSFEKAHHKLVDSMLPEKINEELAALHDSKLAHQFRAAFKQMDKSAAGVNHILDKELKAFLQPFQMAPAQFREELKKHHISLPSIDKSQEGLLTKDDVTNAVHHMHVMDQGKPKPAKSRG